jgi:hypothetical protein
MAVKVNNVTVIDNNRNITNANAMTASGTVSANLFSGSAANLTGIPAKISNITTVVPTTVGSTENGHIWFIF